MFVSTIISIPLTKINVRLTHHLPHTRLVLTCPVRSITAYDCDLNTPCSNENFANGKVYFPHEEPHKFISCGPQNECYVMECAADLIWVDGACAYEPMKERKEV